jgi:glyoxylase-like metal-dependent hydrolase (beta-lactamase superfamily II)
MKARPVTANIIQLTRFHFVNAFLVREADGFTLVDTTMGNAAGALIRAASQAEGAIRRVALTHGHGDHVGALDALKQELGASVEILMPELDARIHAGEQVVEGKLPGSWPKLTTSPDVLLSGGERIGSLETIPSPGHSPGHVAYLDTREGTLIAGDVYTTYGAAAVTNHRYLRFPFAAMATWDRSKDFDSARALRKLDPTILAVGHGPSLRDPGPAMDAAIERARPDAATRPTPTGLRHEDDLSH